MIVLSNRFSIKVLVILTNALMLFGFVNAQNVKNFEQVKDSLTQYNKIDDGITFFEQQLKKYPKNEIVLGSLGHFYYLKNNFDKSEQCYLEILKINKNQKKTLISLAFIQVEKRDLNKALEFINKADKIYSNDALIFMNKGFIYEKFTKLQDALEWYDKAINLDNKNVEYYFRRANLYCQMNNYTNGFLDLDKAIELKPEVYEFYLQKARIYTIQEKYKEALEQISIAIQKDDSKSFLFNQKGIIFSKMQDYTNALTCFQKAVSLDNTDYFHIFNLCSTYYKLEQMDSVCVYAKAIKNLEVKGVDVNKEIISEINGLLREICDDQVASYYYQRGIALYNFNKLEESIKLYDICLKKFPDNVLALSFKGNALMKLGNYREAAECYIIALDNKEKVIDEIKKSASFVNSNKEALTIYYKNFIAETRQTLANCYLNIQEPENALSEINKAIEIIPVVSYQEIGIEKFYCLRGVIYLIMGNTAKALYDFDKSIQYNNKFGVPYMYRALTKLFINEKVKINSYLFSFNNQSVINFSFEKKISKNKDLRVAIADCDVAIALDENLNLAYYIRGYLKMIIGYSDYCLDFLTAKNKGVNVESHLLSKCK